MRMTTQASADRRRVVLVYPGFGGDEARIDPADPARCWECRWAGQACLSSIRPRDVAQRVHEQLAAGLRLHRAPAEASVVSVVEAIA